MMGLPALLTGESKRAVLSVPRTPGQKESGVPGNFQSPPVPDFRGYKKPSLKNLLDLQSASRLC